MAFVYDGDESPLQNAKRHVGYIIQTIENHPENSSLERILADLKKLSTTLQNAK